MPHHPHVRQLDPRAPLVLDTRDLPRRPGVMRTLTRTVPAPVDLGLGLVSVPAGSEIHLDLRLESVTEGVLVSGTVTGGIAGECGRCLREIGDRLTVTIQELYLYEDRATDEVAEEEDVQRLQGDLLDLEPALRDAVVLALPSHPLCREDCPGLCPECGVPLDELPAGHGHQQVDARWAALSKLTAEHHTEQDKKE